MPTSGYIKMGNGRPRQLCYFALMQVSETFQCPFCGQRTSLSVDTSVGDQEFVTDCEVCCRPVQVRIQCEPGEVLSVKVVVPG